MSMHVALRSDGEDWLIIMYARKEGDFRLGVVMGNAGM